MDTETRLTMQQANKILKLNDHEDVSEDPVRHALHEWQKASTEWTELYRRTHSKTNAMGSEHEKKLRRLEKRLNKAADNYEKAKSNDDWFVSPGDIS